MLKEAVLRTGCLRGVTSVADRGNLPEDVLAERLLLAIYAYGTNTGIRAVASDSMHFGSFDQNIFTEWHPRYGGRGVLIYWHVEKGSVVIHSQLLNCSASEVNAMVDGAIRHGTDMAVEANYVDTHGQSEIGFGITRLLGFDLLPRIKRINKVKLYRPAAGEPDLWPGLAPAMTRPIRWPVGQQRQANESFDALERRHHGIADMRDTGVDRRWLCVESGTACIICLLCAGQRLDGAAGQLHRLLAGSVSQWAGR